MNKNNGLRRTTIFMAGLAAFLIGLAVARFPISLSWPWIGLGLILTLVSFKVSRLSLIFCVVLLGVLLGIARGSAFSRQVDEYRQFYDRPVIITGRADSDAVYAKNSQLSFDVSNVQVIEPTSTKLVGKIKVEGFGAAAVYRGDVVRVEGKLRSTLGSRQGRMGFADLEVLGRSNTVVENTRHSFVAGMFSSLPEPLASFGLGLLIGQRNTLPETTTRLLSMVGLTHIIAVSGYNLTILVRGTRRMFRHRSKYQSLVAALGLIASFLLFTGFSASIVRAAVVSILGLLAWYYGRTFRPMLLLILAAALTAGWYPLYLWSDIGWHLSFLAFFGVLILAPLLIKRFHKPARQPHNLSLIIVESMCAQVMTLPLIMYTFHEFSLISLLANILIVPLVPLAMLMALVAGISGMLFPVWASWFALPANLLMTYMLDVVAVLSRIPHAFLSRSLLLWEMIVLYVSVAIVGLVAWRKTDGLAREKLTIEP